MTTDYSKKISTTWQQMLKSLLAFGGLMLPVGASAYASADSANDSRPNFIIFIADDMAWDDCGAYGHPHIKTPHIDQLSHGGMRFDNAFLTCSSCSPSRASLITGRYPHNTGAHQLHLPLSGEQVTFIELLEQAGYYTAAAGKWHMGPATQPKFDTVVTKMNRWVETLHNRPTDQPFCMWFAFTDPHRPYQPNTIDEPHSAEQAIIPPYLPDNQATREDLAAYYDEISRMDAAIGRVMAELAKQGQSDNTMTVFLSDNGRPFPRCKTTVYDSGIKTPWIVHWPKQVKAGSTCQSLISSIDLAPTILSSADVEVPISFQGVSFQPLLADPTQSIRQWIVAEHNWHDFEDRGRAIRSLQYKYISNEYTDVPGTPPADAVRSPTYQSMHKLKEQGKLNTAQLNPYVVPRRAEELYDVVADPHELNNLVRDARHSEVLADLRTQLKQWQEQTEDDPPAKRRADEFDRVTGERLPEFQRNKRKRRRVK